MKSSPMLNSQQYSNQLSSNTIKQINQAQKQHQVREQTYNYKHNVRERAIMMTGSLILFFLIFQFGSQVLKMHYTASSLNKADAQLISANSKNKQLKDEQSKLKDSAYLEQVLRDKYHYTKNGEMIYNLPTNPE